MDFIANKGGAFIFLLHGLPGCEKALTSKAIAELLQKPPYIVTARDLGVTASEVKQMLGNVLSFTKIFRIARSMRSLMSGELKSGRTGI